MEINLSTSDFTNLPDNQISVEFTNEPVTQASALPVNISTNSTTPSAPTEITFSTLTSLINIVNSTTTPIPPIQRPPILP